MKKVIILSVLFLIASCGVQKKIAKDPYVGIYDFTVFEVDNYGDIPVKLTLTKEDEVYTSVMNINREDSSVGEEIEVDATTFEEEFLLLKLTLRDMIFILNLALNKTRFLDR